MRPPSSATRSGDPFKDTSSVAMNPVIKFTTLFGLLAVELGVQLAEQYGARTGLLLSGLFLAGSVVFVWRSFYAMRIVREAAVKVCRRGGESVTDVRRT